jgi:chlorobactene glucosyltransferase
MSVGSAWVDGLPWAVSAPALLALGLTVVNALSWARARKGPDAADTASASALVPARNEEAAIEDCVRSLLAEPFDEVVVYDDGSTDGTPAILARMQAEHPRLRVVRGAGLPEGWVGKPHACQRLGEHAVGDLRVFVDADVRVEPGALSRIRALAADVDVLTAVPRQLTGSFMEHLVLPLLHLTYVSWLPLALIPLVRDPRVLAANGQLLAVRRAAWERLGGFSCARADVVDDMAFCRAAKRAGLRVRFADGHLLARCRMYTRGAEVWSGFSKNLYEGLGASPLALLGVLVLYTWAFVLPWALLPFGGAPAAVGVAANLAQRVLLAVRHRHSPLSVVLHPVAVCVLLAIAVNSWRWHARGEIAWRGRTYAPRAARGLAGSGP